MLRSALLKSPRSIYISGSIVSPSRGRKDLALSYTSSKPTMHHRMCSLCFSVSGLQVPIKKAFGIFLAILHSFNSSQQTLKIMKGPNIAVLCDFYFKEQGEQAMSSFSLSTQNYRCLKNRGLALCRNAFGTAWCLCVSVCLRHLSAQNNHVSALRFLCLWRNSLYQYSSLASLHRLQSVNHMILSKYHASLPCLYVWDYGSTIFDSFSTPQVISGMLETKLEGMVPWSPLKYKSTYTGIFVCVWIEHFLLKTPILNF